MLKRGRKSTRIINTYMKENGTDTVAAREREEMDRKSTLCSKSPLTPNSDTWTTRRGLFSPSYFFTIPEI